MDEYMWADWEESGSPFDRKPQCRLAKLWAKLSRRKYVDLFINFDRYEESLMKDMPFGSGNLDSWATINGVTLSTGFNHKGMEVVRGILIHQYGVKWKLQSKWIKFPDVESKTRFMMTYSAVYD